MRKKGQQTAPFVDTLPTKVRITHPFHPLFNNEFDLITFRRDWLYERVECLDANGHPFLIPLAWTNAAEEDPFVTISGGRSFFRVEDLIRLADLMDELKCDD